MIRSEILLLVFIGLVQLLFLGAWLLLFFGFYKRWHIKKGYVWLISLLFLLIVLATVMMVYYDAYRPHGIIIQDKLSVYNGPDTALYTIGTVPQGAVVYIKGRQKKWYKIVYDGLEGWAQKSGIVHI